MLPVRPLLALVTALLGIVLSVGALGAGAAQAHSFLESSNPADGLSIAQSPGTVTLTFNEPVQKQYAAVTVIGPGDTSWSQTDPVVAGKNVTTEVGALGEAGKYTVNYKITSADGHVVTGSTGFTLTADGDGTPSAVPVAEKDSGVPAWPFILVAVLIVVAAVGWTFRPKRG